MEHRIIGFWHSLNLRRVFIFSPLLFSGIRFHATAEVQVLGHLPSPFRPVRCKWDSAIPIQTETPWALAAMEYVFGVVFHPRYCRPRCVAWFLLFTDFGARTQAFIELNAAMVIELYNCRFFHAYLDEDTIGTIKGIAKRCHRKLLETRCLMRWLLRLKYYLRH